MIIDTIASVVQQVDSCNENLPYFKNNNRDRFLSALHRSLLKLVEANITVILINNASANFSARFSHRLPDNKSALGEFMTYIVGDKFELLKKKNDSAAIRVFRTHFSKNGICKDIQLEITSEGLHSCQEKEMTTKGTKPTL